jgi:hypothetical protein
MVMRALAALALCLVQVSGAWAEERSGLMRRLSCTVVRYYVAKYTAPAAEAWARSKGATDKDIEAARHCLADQTLQASLGAPSEAR